MFVVEVAQRSDAWIPSFFHFGVQTDLHVPAQVIDVFLRHAKLDIHEDDVVIVLAVTL